MAPTWAVPGLFAFSKSSSLVVLNPAQCVEKLLFAVLLLSLNVPLSISGA